MRRVVAVVAALGAAAFLVGFGDAAAVAVGDTWEYLFHEQDPGIEWFGNTTVRFAGGGSPIVFDRFGAGIFRGNVNGTWAMYEANRYRPTDGAFMGSNGTFRLVYVELGQTNDVVTTTTVTDDPPVELGGTLQVGNVVSATTNETVTEVVTVNNGTGNSTTQTTMVTIQERIVSQAVITVPAGTFDTWLIEYTQSDIPGRTEQYYSTDVGSSVLIRAYDGTDALRATYSLKRYGPGDAAPSPPSGTAYLGPATAVGATGVVVALVVWRDRRRVRPIGGFAGIAPPPPPPQR